MTDIILQMEESSEDSSGNPDRFLGSLENEDGGGEQGEGEGREGREGSISRKYFTPFNHNFLSPPFVNSLVLLSLSFPFTHQYHSSLTHLSFRSIFFLLIKGFKKDI